MSLLADIQAECTSPVSSVSRLLRLCLQLAARLRHTPLKEWALHELNGYPDSSEIPSYRIFGVRSQGFFLDRFIGKGTLDIPLSVLPEELRDSFRTAKLGGAISQYENLLANNDGTSLQIPWPVDLARIYGSKISPMQCINAWKEIPPAALVGLLDTVKTRVLMMALEIEAEDPGAGDIPSAPSTISEAVVSQIFNTNIYGGQVQNLAAGSTNVAQIGTNHIGQGDSAALTTFLKAQGLGEQDTSQLVTALDADKSEGTQGIGTRAAAWLARFGSDAGSKTLVGVATQAILAYLGISKG